MTDIVERLRDYATTSNRPSLWPGAMSEAAAEIERLRVIAKLFQERNDEIERLRAALAQIEQWSQAYPLQIFPEPDLVRAAELLRAGGITLDAVSASVMRHAIESVGKIAHEAFK